MNDLERTRLSDRMPRVALGEDEWTPAELGRLTGDADLAAEWRVVQAVVRLGERGAARVDPRRVAAAVAARLDEPASVPARRARRQGWWAVTGLAAAAAVFLVLWPAVRGPAGTAPAGTAGGTATVTLTIDLPELEALDETSLAQVLNGVGTTGTGGTLEATTAPATDLTETELNTLLGELEEAS